MKYISFLILIIVSINYIYAQIPAFPGAEGFGSTSIGGRGGKIIEVTNLNDSGIGSLRAACESSGPRIIVFKTGGSILLSSAIYIFNPYITIAGQSAPGDGILIRGAAIRPATHDVIIRGLRIRVGDDSNGPPTSNRDGVSIENQSVMPFNIIIDHCSISWATDENIVTWYKSHDITIQWCISSEALLNVNGEDSYGMLLGYEANRISIHHNLLEHNSRRNPLAQGGPSTFEIINNLIYNWGVQAMSFESETSGICKANVINNYFLPGPSTSVNWINKMIWLKTSGAQSLNPESKFFVKGNIGPGREDDTYNEWDAVDGPKSFQSNSPTFELSGVLVNSTNEIYDLIVPNAGAIVPFRDKVDTRLISDLINKTGKIITSQSEVGGWPILKQGTPLPDSDHDGMPDDWEINVGLSPYNSSDANGDIDENGYTNVEDYLNSLIQISNYSSEVAAPQNFKIDSN